MSRKLRYTVVRNMYPTGSTVVYEENENTINYVIPIVKGSTYTITFSEVGNRIRIVALSKDPRTLTSTLSSGVTKVVMDPEFDVGYSTNYVSTIDGFLIIYVSNVGALPRVKVETDGVGGDGLFSYHSACSEVTSGTSLIASIKTYFRGYVLATVSTRSATTFSDDWEVLHESTEISSEDTINQKMYFLSRKVAVDEDVSLTITQENSGRIYANLIVFESAKGFQYHEGTEKYSNTKVTSATATRPTQSYVIWGCSAISWSSTSSPWKCDDLSAISITTTQPRQASFVDYDASVTERTFSFPSSAYLIDSIELLPRDLDKYLVRAEGSVYTISEGSLDLVDETAITSALFQEKGTTVIPTWDLISDLVEPEVLVWQSDEEAIPELSVKMSATPFPQSIISDKAFTTHETITGIENMVATCEGELIVAVSFDDKQTWKAWNGEQWASLSEDFTGMNKETLEGVTFEQWNELFQGADGFYLRVSLLDTSQSVSEIYVDFAN